MSKPTELDELIEQAKNAPPMTEEELRAQRESWVRGEMAIGLDASEAEFRAAAAADDDTPSP